MARPKKADEVKVAVVRDGVFLRDSVRLDKGDTDTIPVEQAEAMEKAGLVRIL